MRTEQDFLIEVLGCLNRTGVERTATPGGQAGVTLMTRCKDHWRTRRIFVRTCQPV